MVNTFDTALYGLIAIFTLIVLFMIMVFLVGGYLFPIFTSDSFTPKAGDAGVSASAYTSTINLTQTGGEYAFYIIIGTVFAYIVLKYLYEKEQTSVSMG